MQDQVCLIKPDVPSNYVDGYLPILDLEVNINKDEQNRIDFPFYEKTTKNGAVLLPDAACSAQQKRTILTQERLRRLRNTKKFT